MIYLLQIWNISVFKIFAFLIIKSTVIEINKGARAKKYSWNQIHTFFVICHSEDHKRAKIGHLWVAFFMHHPLLVFSNKLNKISLSQLVPGKIEKTENKN